ncbi:MAG: hypothetical protein JEZ00_06305 [Anaerolineaceae bacterium]|nr:hypothetical protein [Anaerolineaceae bacterium]
MGQNDANETNGNNNNKTEKTGGKGVAVIIIGALALAGFAWFIIYLTGFATDPKLDDVVWLRLTYLLTGVEAIAFSAAGYFFGKEVNRQHAESADERANNSEHEAGEAKKDAVKKDTQLKALAKGVLNAENKKREDPTWNIDERRGTDADLSALADMARGFLTE